jgi:hypothetical protein
MLTRKNGMFLIDGHHATNSHNSIGSQYHPVTGRTDQYRSIGTPPGNLLRRPKSKIGMIA